MGYLPLDWVMGYLKCSLLEVKVDNLKRKEVIKSEKAYEAVSLRGEGFYPD